MLMNPCDFEKKRVPIVLSLKYHSKLVFKVAMATITRTFSFFQFTWESYISSVMSMEHVDIVINGSEPVIVRALPYYEQLASVLNRYSARYNYGICMLSI